MVPTISGGTQDTDFNKGFTKGNFNKTSSAKKWGGQGDPDPLTGNRRKKIYELRKIYKTIQEDTTKIIML